MENRHRIWIIAIIVFSFNFLTVNELTAERQWFAKAVKLNQPIYFKGILILKFVPKIYCFGREVLLLCPQKMRTCGLLPGTYDFINQDQLKIL